MTFIFCVGFDPPPLWCPKNCWVYGRCIEHTMATMGKPSNKTGAPPCRVIHWIGSREHLNRKSWFLLLEKIINIGVFL